MESSVTICFPHISKDIRTDYQGRGRILNWNIEQTKLQYVTVKLFQFNKMKAECFDEEWDRRM